MVTPSNDLVNELLRLADDLPDELVGRVADLLCESARPDWPWLRTAVLRRVPHRPVRERLLQFLDYWQGTHPEVAPQAVALALHAAAQAALRRRADQSLELVWTGPETRHLTLRQTEQALLQVIHEAQTSLHIVSFAVYKATTITQALTEAAQRGVDIAIYLETPDTSANRVGYDTVQALGSETRDWVRLYVWPLDKRPMSPDGRRGSLHVKLALADGQVALISSANLTEYAMSLNMEVGILMRGGAIPSQLEAHLTALVEAGIFEELHDG